jgi:DNA-binding beta-propeller fold protein YncE
VDRPVLIAGVLSALVLAALGVVAGCGGDAGSAGPEPLKTTVMFGEVGQSPGQFEYPRCLDTDGRQVWVIDKAAHVQRIDPATGRCTAWWQMPEFVQGKPTGVTVGPQLPAAEGRAPSAAPYLLYVPDTHYHRVMVYEPPEGMGQEPRLIAKFGSYGEGPGQFIYPTDVAIVPGADGRASRLYVSEYGGHDRISVFDARDLSFLFSFGVFGTGESESPGQEPTPPVEFNRPQSMGLDLERGMLAVTDACNHRVGVFTLEGKLVRWIGSPAAAGSGPEGMAYPYGLAMLGDGTALVCEYGNHRLRWIDLRGGETLAILGTAGRGKGELSTPWGVAATADMVYVLDSGNARVQGFPLARIRDGGASRRREAGPAAQRGGKAAGRESAGSHA